MKTKQVLIIRKDLKMRRGKECAQAAHASLAVFFNMMKDPNTGYIKEEKGEFHSFFKHSSPAINDWMTNRFTKICVTVNSEAELLAVYEEAKRLNLPCSLIKDAGLTEFKEPTYTTVAVGPAESELIDQVTGKLPLY